MRYVGFDLGTRTLGIAISDSSAKIAFSKKTIVYENEDLKALALLACDYLKEEKVNDVILGLPKHMNGDLSISGERSLNFKDELLIVNPDLHIEMWDERLTTTMALNTIAHTKVKNKAKKRKEKVDALAACNILQSYLDKLNRG